MRNRNTSILTTTEIDFREEIESIIEIWGDKILQDCEELKVKRFDLSEILYRMKDMYRLEIAYWRKASAGFF